MVSGWSPATALITTAIYYWRLQVTISARA